MATIHVVSYFPADPHQSGDCGFEWFDTWEEAIQHLRTAAEEDDGMAYLLRPVRLPADLNANNVDNITHWLNTKGVKLWNVEGELVAI